MTRLSICQYPDTERKSTRCLERNKCEKSTVGCSLLFEMTFRVCQCSASLNLYCFTIGARQPFLSIEGDDSTSAQYGFTRERLHPQ